MEGEEDSKQEAPKFAVNQTVYRIEDRAVTRATVVQVDYQSGFGYIYFIQYHEGGSGYWSEDCLTAENSRK